MAELLSRIAANIIGKLGSSAIQEIGVWWNAKDELDKLEDTVSTIQDVLLDAEEEYEPSRQFKNWLGKLRSVLYDADELLDDFSTEVLRRQLMTAENNIWPTKVCLFLSRSNQFVYDLKLGHKVKAIRKSLDAVANDRQKFHFKVRQTKRPFLSQERFQTITLEQRERRSVQREGNVFGRESDKNAIIDEFLLLESDAKDGVPVLPIVGTGGLGKTTLAKLVHDDEKVKNHFDVRMRVFVGDVDLSEVEVARNGTKSAIDRQSKLLSLSQENDEVKKFKAAVVGKKILLVLDDVWSEDRDMWSNLEDLWRNASLESRIIVTTRSLNVAKMTSNSKPYKLGDLSLDDCWNLFVEIVFEGQEPENEDVKNNGKIVVEKCAGVPLAIKTIGNMLYFLNPETEWLPFVKNELSNYPQANNDIFPTLKLSYDHLPSPLKYCFTYCKLFPKGYEIDVKTLVQLWIAQGCIKPSDLGESLEYVGLQYCKVLVSRSFLEEEKVDELGNLISCRMHDIMHDLASFLGDDVNVVTSKSLGKNLNKNTHHMSIDINDFSEPFVSLELLESLLQTRKLRTFIFSMLKSEGLVFKGLKVDQCDKICKKLQSLLVLELSGNKLKKIPNSISNLKHLRYLDFSRSRKIKKLPNSITRLINLQVLKLCHCERLEELPKDINKLINLKHLDCEGCDRLKYMPSGLGQMTLLQTLTLFVIGAQNQNQCSCASPCTVACRCIGGLKELSKLNSLTGSLEIRKLKYISEYEAAKIEKKQLLQSLKVYWDEYYGVDDENVDDDYNKMSLQNFPLPPNLKELFMCNYKCQTFPGWPRSLSHLVELDLGHWRRCEHLPPLDQLPSLRVLSISFCESEYIEIGSGPTFFPSLERLKLSNCEKMKGWRKTAAGENNTSATSITTELPQFSCLFNLDIYKCPNLNLETIPMASKLQKLWVWRNEVATTFPNWVSSLTNLVEIRLSYFKRCEHLPPLDQIPTLRVINIRDFDNLKYMKIFGSGPTFFPSLNRLYLEDCGKLKGWRKKGEHDDDDDDDTSITSTVRYCPVLKGLRKKSPQFHSLSELTIDNCPQMILESFLHLIPSVQQLQISNFPDLEYIEIFGSGPTFFRSLNTLSLKRCGKLKGWRKKGEHHDDTATTTSTADLPQFHSLSELISGYCPVLSDDDDDDSDTSPQFHSLSELTIYNCPQLIWENFPPTPKLNKMMVSGYEGISFPRCWLPSLLTNIVEIKLSEWRRCKYLPPLDQIPSLQQLIIDYFDNLEYIGFGSGPTFFPSLKKFRLHSCRNLKGWRKEGNEDTATAEQLPQFPCLSELRIWNCRNLSSMPLFPTLDVELELTTVKQEILVRSLSNLKRLFIAEIEDLQSLPTEWLRNLTSLQSLTIGDCPSLTHLPQEMQCLDSLQKLNIRECHKLKKRCGNNKGVDWPNIAHIPNIQIDFKKIQVEGYYQLHNLR